MNIEGLYKEKLMSAEEAVLLIPEVGSISIGMRVATPPALIEAVAKRARHGNIKDLRVYYMRSGGKALETLFQEDLLDVVHPYSSMLTKEEAKLVVAGFKKGKKLINFVPISFSRYPETISKLIDLDTFLVTVAPMDKHGYFNFGTNGDYAIELSRHAKKLIVEVNENMPRTAGESLLHISEVDAIIENTVPLLEEKSHPLTEVDHKIGQIIAPMICDGATIQIGIGRVPNAVAEHIVNDKDLGIHTEVITSRLIDLIKNGVVTNSKKRINRHVSVFTFAIGDRSVYDFIDDNLSMACMPVSYVNKPEIIGKNPNMVSINSFVEIDFFGQVNSEYIGHQFSRAGVT
ncbi:acetyl-CoA hydrolase/transferase family protein [Francisella orientalis]|uniref:acetyl-CoA hydrolase/transferase family protein n=1 Tax=Francisella orientalis TaxID=299583 RepID=UPI0004131455|nr:acetyl-CoA hydrolase/transferase family protein [Francisella orientalis]